jgi:spore coat polysaccharide biosynthesis protein SpsF
MNISIIIQARLGSKRLPNKMLCKLGNYSIIEWVIIRLKKSNLANSIILATTNNKEDDALVSIAKDLGIKVFRGNEHNVLKRIYHAANKAKSNIVVRVCADNPFIDAAIVDKLISFFLSKELDYAFNHQPKLNCNISDGFGAEVFNISLLRRLNEIVVTQLEKEHATLYIWNNIESFVVESVPVPQELAFRDLKFDIDTEDDLLRLNSLVDKHSLTTESSAVEFVKSVILVQ